MIRRRNHQRVRHRTIPCSLLPDLRRPPVCCLWLGRMGHHLRALLPLRGPVQRRRLNCHPPTRRRQVTILRPSLHLVQRRLPNHRRATSIAALPFQNILLNLHLFHHLSFLLFPNRGITRDTKTWVPGRRQWPCNPKCLVLLTKSANQL